MLGRLPIRAYVILNSHTTNEVTLSICNANAYAASIGGDSQPGPRMPGQGRDVETKAYMQGSISSAIGNAEEHSDMY